MDFKKLISQMTFEEKVGQLAQYNANVWVDTDGEITGPATALGLKKEDIYKVGSILNFSRVEEMQKMQKAHLENVPFINSLLLFKLCNISVTGNDK